MAKRIRRTNRELAWTSQWKQELPARSRATPENFKFLRETLMTLSITECAEILGVTRSTVRTWETGEARLPYMAYVLLDLVMQRPTFRLSSVAWAGWQVSTWFDGPRKKTVTALTNQVLGASFEPDQLEHIHGRLQEVSRLESEIRELRNQVGGLTAANTRLRELFRTNGVSSELEAMNTRISQLVSEIRTAQVLDFPLEVKRVA